jgi:hypothetical protein
LGSRRRRWWWRRLGSRRGRRFRAWRTRGWLGRRGWCGWCRLLLGGRWLPRKVLVALPLLAA